ncbi:MAG: tetratricopeptide repeat protein [Terracidiphilus sp.]
MANEPTAASTASPSLQATHVYVMAVLCLVAGLAIGHLLRGWQTPVSPAQPTAVPAPPSPAAAAMRSGHVPTMDEMKQMADQQAAPLLEKLKSDPNNSAVLIQVGAIYHTTHRFKEAAAYYGRAVQIDPRNVAIRTKLASSLYRSGDADGAIAQLNQALVYDPKDANALFDLGLIRLQGKQDGKGAVAAWQQLLKSNPQLSAERKATVLKLMADVMTTLGDQHGIKGARSNDGHKSNSH